MDNKDVNNNTNIDKRKKRLAKGITKQPEIDTSITTAGASFLAAIAPPDNYNRNDPKQAQEQLQKYIDAVINTGRKAGNMQMYFALGVDNRDVPYLTSKNNALSDTIKKGQLFCRAMREIYMDSGELNPVIGIFWQKNFDHLQDKQEFIVNTGVNDEIPADKLIENARTLPVDPENI